MYGTLKLIFLKYAVLYIYKEVLIASQVHIFRENHHDTGSIVMYNVFLHLLIESSNIILNLKGRNTLIT